MSGLSRGGGEPGDFRASDLSAYPGPSQRTLAIVAPNGGEIVARDASVDIRWSVAGTDWTPADAVSLQYSADGGASWQPIAGAASLPHDQGSFAWSASGLVPGYRYLVRVLFLGDAGLRDDSDDGFSILGTDRQIDLLTPAAGDFIDIGQFVPIIWTTGGGDWRAGDTVRLEFSLDAGATWATIPGAETVPHDQGAFSWDTSGWARGDRYRVRVVWTTGPSVGDATAANLVLRRIYYVNDGSTANDVWCNAAGNDGSSGTSPSAPKATVQSLLVAHDLGPGDVVRIDTGNYTLSSNISVSEADGGTENAPVTFEASPYGVTLGRNTTASGTYAWYAIADHVVLRTATSDKYPAVPQKWLTITGGQYGVYLSGAIGFRLERAHVIATFYSPSYTSYGISVYQSHGTVLRNVISQRHSSRGIYVSSSDGCAIENATILRNGTYGIYAYNSQALSLQNNVIWADGSGDYCVYLSGGSLISDHNDLYATSGANVGYYASAQSGLGSWQTATGQDAHTISADPKFADADGPDNSAGNADDDFHLASSAGSYHNGAWTGDATDSAAIDMGFGDAAVEPEPNSSSFATETEGRRNLGAYGRTEQASKTPPSRLLAFGGPTGGEKFSDPMVPIAVTWRLAGSGWNSEDTIQVLYSSDGGITYQPIGGAEAVLAQSGGFVWDPNGLAGSAGYRLKILNNADGSALAETTSIFRVGSSAFFYVNDGWVMNEAWCTAAGNDANTGLSPAAPKATVQAIIDAYDLEPGDTVRIDSGNYSSFQNITINNNDAGAVGNPVVFEGSPYGTLLARINRDPGTACWRISATNVMFRTALPTQPTALPVSWMSFGSGSNSVELIGAHGVVFERMRVVATAYSSAIVATNSSDVVIRNTLLLSGKYPNSFIACDDCTLDQSTIDGPGLTFANCSNAVIRNSIVSISGSDRRAFDCLGGSLHSDYNDLFVSGGAIVARKEGMNLLSLDAWRVATSNDLNSISSDPRFADDYHVKSTEGRYMAGAWNNDAADSPTIDMGFGDAAQEQEPNSSAFATDTQGRRNLGAYGGTELASKTASGRGLTVRYPAGGEKLPDVQKSPEIRWQPVGQGWQPGDTVQILVSSNGGVGFGPLAGGEAVPLELGAFAWNLTNAPKSPGYRLRFVSNADSNTLAETPVNIRFGSGPFAFYVNDSSVATDAWCVAAGGDTNSGISPASPRPSVQSILADYDLDPGDVVRIDTGTYSLTNNITVGVSHEGSNGHPVSFSASPYGVTFDRGTNNAGSFAWNLMGRHLAISTSGSSNHPSAPQAWAAFKGGYDTVCLQKAGNVVLDRLRLIGAAQRGVYAFDADGSIIRNCLVQANGGSGLELASSDECSLEQNTILANGKHAINISASTNTHIANNVLLANGVGNSVIYSPYATAVSDHNVLLASGGASIGHWGGGARSTMAEWRAASGQDTYSLNVDPRFVDADGPDNIGGNEDDDLHLQSTAGSYHGGSWIPDAADSPGIDSGSGDAGEEPAPNSSSVALPDAGRRNLGAYGGTAQASKTPSGSLFWLSSPLGGERFLDPGTVLPISWRWSGRGWMDGDTLGILGSGDGGATFDALSGAAALGITNGFFGCDTTGLAPSAAYRIRIVRNSDGSILGESTANFRVGYGACFFVNDGSTNLDVWCSSVGNDANDGATPGTPKASVQDLLSTHKLEPGDTVRIETGFYPIQTDVYVGADDAGAPGSQVVFEASPSGVCFDRGTNSGIGWNLGANYVTLRTARPLGPTGTRASWMRVCGGDIGIQLFRAIGFQAQRLSMSRSRQYGLYSFYSYDGSIENCLSYSNRVGFYIEGTERVRLENNTGSYNSDYAIQYSTCRDLTVRNNIFAASGDSWNAAVFVSSLYGSNSIDFNLLSATEDAAPVSLSHNRLWSLSDIHAGLGQESHSATLPAAFVDPDGPDDILGTADDDFHVQSTAGSYHGGKWTVDATDSPAIDLGLGDAGFETEPNSSTLATDEIGRRNLGAYGGTEQASRTPSAAHLWLTVPAGGEKILDRTNPVRIGWRATGNAWSIGDSLTALVSPDGGRTFRVLDGAEALNPMGLEFFWDITEEEPSRAYRIRLETAAGAVPMAETQSPFRIGVGAPLYINDTQTNLDEWCIAPGDDSNDGLTPASPRATLASVFSSYPLEAGDVVRIDTGTYPIEAGVTVPDSADGTAELPIVVEGSPYGVEMVRSGTQAGSRAFTVGGQRVTVRTARGFRHPTAHRTMMNIAGGETALYAIYAHGLRLEGIRLSAAGKYGFYSHDSENGVLADSLVDRAGVAGLYLFGSKGWDIVGSTIALGVGDGLVFNAYSTNDILSVHNSVFSGAGTSGACLKVLGGRVESDFNNLVPVGGAAVGDWNGRHVTLADWQAATKRDTNSISADPLFVDPDGADDVPGNWDDDFHLQSTAGSYHGGAWLADGADSPAIDMGDPTVPVGAETAPNGLIVNLGAYGGTEQASRSADADGDELSNQFETVRSGTDPSRFDTDGDGRGDGAEIIAATDPLDPTSYFHLGPCVIVGDDAIVRFPTSSDRDYVVEFSNDLREWEALPNGTVTGTGAIVELHDPGARSRPCRFYRVRVLW